MNGMKKHGKRHKLIFFQFFNTLLCHPSYCYFHKPDASKMNISSLKTLRFSPSLTTFISLLLACYFLIIMHISIPNMGGSGLKVPQNILALGIIGALVLLVNANMQTTYPKTLRTSPGTRLLLIGCLLLCIPIFWSSRPMWRWNAFPAVLGYAVAALGYLALLQVRLSPQQKRRWLALILISAVIEALLALLQLFVLPANNWMEYSLQQQRIFGIFQQPNLLGSYLATGCGIALYFIFTSRSRLVRHLASASLGLQLLVLIPTQSRIGWSGAGTVIAVLLWHFRARSSLRNTLMIVIPLALMMSLIAAIILVPGRELLPTLPDTVTQFAHHPAFTPIDKSHSTHLRWQMLVHSLHMIAERPLIGWGMGGFEHSFTQHVVEMNHSMTLGGRPPTHPHNEILFQWIEGGIVAMLGMLLLIAAWLKLGFVPRGLRRQRAFPIWCLTLPIVLHTQFEYPLHLSAAHSIVLVLLLRLTLKEKQLRQHRIPVPLHHAGRFASLGLALTLMVFAATGLRTHLCLTAAERNAFHGMEKCSVLPNPWVQWERMTFDQQMYKLQRFNQTRDYHYLEEFQVWGDKYIKVHNDANVYHSLILIAQAQQSNIRKNQLLARAHLLFPTDRRFQ